MTATQTPATNGRTITRLKDVAVSVTDRYQLDPRTIRIQEGFNARDFTAPDNIQHIRNLADSIKVIGVLVPIIVRFENQQAWIVDGESRLRASLLAISEGLDLVSIPAIAENRGTDPRTRLLSTFTLNDDHTRKPFSMLESGRNFAQLISMGMSEKAIAEAASRSESHVRNCLSLVEAGNDVKAAVKDGTISESLAATLVRKHGSTAAAEAIEAAKDSGAKHVTKKSIEQAVPRLNRNDDPTAGAKATRRYTSQEGTTLVKAMTEIHALAGNPRLGHQNQAWDRVHTITQNVLESLGVIDAE
jgi:ParB/RepB/Spo0J family partition protein